MRQQQGGKPSKLVGALVVLGLIGFGAAAVPQPAYAAGSTLDQETFQNATVQDPRWLPLNDACLTAQTAGTAAPADASALGGCTQLTDSVMNLGSGTDGYLQLTDNGYFRSGGAVFDRAFPSSAGLVVSFDQYQYAATSTGDGPADGIGFFLSDGSYTLNQTGPQGGSLGYATQGGSAGLEHGYLGVGLDVYGNYENQPFVGVRCPDGVGVFSPGSVALRGSGDGLGGYCLLGYERYGQLRNAPAVAPGGAQGTPQRVTVTISPTTSADPYPSVTVEINGTVILTQRANTPAPATLKFGFAASTGGGHEVHMIRNVAVSTVNALGAINLVKTVDHTDRTGTPNTIFTEGDRIPYSFVVTNSGAETLTGVAVTDPKIADIVCPATTLAAANSFVCTGTYGPLTAAEASTGTFTNTATVTGIDEDGTPVTANDTSTVPTYTQGTVSVTKRVTGNAISQLPADAPFSVRYSYPAGVYQPANDPTQTYPAGSGTLTLIRDQTATSPPIPTGADVTFSEDTPAAIPDTTWSTPTIDPNHAVVGDTGPTAVVVTNTLQQVPGSISWTKTDPDGTLLAGSEWSLTPADGGDAVQVADNGTGDADPAAGALRVEDLSWGDYTLTETRAPDGFLPDITPRTITIGPGALTAELGAISNDPAPAVTGTVTWTKTDTDGVLLPGSDWTLTGPDGSTVIADRTGPDDTAADEDPTAGAFRVTGLPIGAYTLTERTAPDGYELDPTAHRFALTADDPSLDLGAFTNTANSVVPPVTPTPTPLPGSGVEPPGGLPESGVLAFTGSPLGVGTIVLAMLLLGGGAALLVRNRRAHSTKADAS
ncbi:SpaA isopeptide-forming pilin-related protein [Curtobacterium sp. A7_M15]|uniref:SpaA isopeptide-forming pilin-related protein n=1 Tax=Curtobacterium sp. A7_M15 TaxID=3065241 RepID=UPI002737DBD0|nr:SpaA isopeptide-forming pilin-related protein [Curtobacterium sp. A7_M15]MDP4331988.1 SpaA isopeptide-forming pilin-related protein [Curtobacterium sp. A7_M15]